MKMDSRETPAFELCVDKKANIGTEVTGTSTEYFTVKTQGQSILKKEIVMNCQSSNKLRSM